MEQSLDDRIHGTIALIRALNANLDYKINEFETIGKLVIEPKDQVIEDMSLSKFELAVFIEILGRINLFIKQNFDVIETMSLLGVTRYIFEVVVWLKLLLKDEKYYYVFYYFVTKEHLKLREELLIRYSHEIKMLEEFSKAEEKLSRDARNGQEFLRLRNQIDAQAKRKFFIFAHQAITDTGFAFQAHLLRTKAIPSIIADIEKLKLIQSKLAQKMTIAKVEIPSRWNWKDKANLVDLSADYDFIYSYTSRFMHAIPYSMFVAQKNMDPQEIIVFLEYINVSILDILDMMHNTVQKHNLLKSN